MRIRFIIVSFFKRQKVFNLIAFIRTFLHCLLSAIFCAGARQIDEM